MNPHAVNRVAVTGVGIISPIGNSLAAFSGSLAEARPGISRLSSERTGGSGVEVAACVDWNPALLEDIDTKHLDHVSQFALAAADQAMKSSGLEKSGVDQCRVGVYWGTGMGGAETIDAGYKSLYTTGVWRTHPLNVIKSMNSAAGSNLSLRYGLRGPFANFSTACSSAAMAIGEAMRTISAGRADAILVGGSEALLTPGMLLAWHASRTYATTDKHNMSASCKPFDIKRTGLVLGEGAGAFVLENETQARARGAQIYGLVTGYGNSCDAVHISRPDCDGQVRAMLEALADAGLEPRDVAYVNAHGTATPVGDIVEAAALNKVFGPHTSDLLVSSTKSLHGHLLGASGAIEFAVALVALKEGLIAPTGFLDEPDPECALHHVAIKSLRIQPPRAVMSNSFAFGGSNVVLIAEQGG
jgi:3-oxoacyl-[acyl-carrier-protein] synthase II